MNVMDRSVLDSRSLVMPQTLRKKALGAYYTPLKVTRLLCDWAIRESTDTVLEPCFGGCTFVEASVERLESLGVRDPGANLFGCDIDPNAFRYLHDRVPQVRNRGQFFQADFLCLRRDQIPEGVDAVVGNPPYVSLAKLDSAARHAVGEWEQASGYHVGRRASLWAHFTLHSLGFVKPGGRIAWVLPAALLTSKYSSSARSEICARFDRVAFITIAERLFIEEGTEERTVILLAEGFRAPCPGGAIAHRCLDNVEQLARLVEQWSAFDWRSTHQNQGTGLVPERAPDLLSELGRVFAPSALGDFAEVEIGVVAGDSRFLIKSAQEWVEHGVSESNLQYVVPPSRWIDGLVVRKKDEREHISNGVRCLALNAARAPRQKALVAYLSRYSEEAIKNNATFSKREVWHQFLDDKTPDGFFVFMTHLGPRLVLNGVGANATNALYRVYFKSGCKKHQKLISISLQTTACQVAAELIGNFRGSGALKLEPSDARRLPIFMPKKTPNECDIAFRQMDEMIRRGEPENARALADAFIYGDSPDIKRTLKALKEDLMVARRRRMRSEQEGE